MRSTRQAVKPMKTSKTVGMNAVEIVYALKRDLGLVCQENGINEGVRGWCVHAHQHNEEPVW